MLIIPVTIAVLYTVGWLCGTIFPTAMDIFFWWLKIEDYATDIIPPWVLIIIDIITAPIAYVSVGAIFDAFGWYDSKIMHYVNAIMTTIITVTISLVIRFFMDYWWIAVLFLSLGLVIKITTMIVNKCKLNIEKEKK